VVIPVVMTAPIMAGKRSGARLRAGSARGMACRQSRVGGLIGDAGRGRASPSLQVGKTKDPCGERAGRFACPLYRDGRQLREVGVGVMPSNYPPLRLYERRIHDGEQARCVE
jgi:hypothetical protein